MRHVEKGIIICCQMKLSSHFIHKMNAICSPGYVHIQGQGCQSPLTARNHSPPKQNAGPQRDPGAESLVEIWGQKLNNTRYFSANSERKFNEFTGKTRSFCKDVASSEPNLLYVCKPRNGCDINIFNLGLHKNWVYF